MTSFTSKMVLFRITTTSSASPSICSYPNAGLGKQPQKTRSCILGHQDHLIQHHAIVFVGIFKDCVFLTSLPQNLLELQRQIIAAISATDCDMLQQVWAEMDYQLEVYHVTKGGHTYHF
jgi:hypothetical protein